MTAIDTTTVDRLAQLPDIDLKPGVLTASWRDRESTKRHPIEACDVADWLDPYDSPSHYDTIRDACVAWAKERATVQITRDPGDHLTPSSVGIESSDLFVCIVHDRATGDELELPISDTFDFGDTEADVSFRIERIYVKSIDRTFTAVVGEVVN